MGKHLFYNSFIHSTLSVHLSHAMVFMFIEDTNINKIPSLSPEHSETKKVDRYVYTSNAKWQ